ncbi:MAG: F0F1 ATP synthase subunit B [Candidatus Obscuribacterales bacterium]|nr:F0F1 ATP synthase subunit B [Candidatus Obscuribacterales bacterium]
MEGIVAIFSNNLINWLLLVFLLAYLWSKVTPAMFAQRKEAIESALKEAERARQEATEFAKQQEERVANAEIEAAKILDEAKKLAAEMKAEIEAQTENEAKAMKERIHQQIKAEQQLAITEMRSRAATVAVRLAEASLPGAITSSSKDRLHNQFVEQLDNGGIKK